jgi:CubicO group peptidase (beta-lactamase class C family)
VSKGKQGRAGGALCVLASAALGVTLGPARLASQPRPLAGVDTYVERTMRDWGIPGVALAVVKDDSLVWSRGFGVRRLGDTTRVDAETIFAIGSITKSFTAAALGLLVDEGKLGWDDRVEERLPGFELADPYVTREVTVKDLLSHRTGLPGNNLLFWGSSFTRGEVIRRVRFLPLRSSLRSRFEYQNIMFIAAGEVIPAVTGTSWDAFVRDRIFGPLGMSRSATSVKELPRFQNVASPHAPRGGSMQPIAWLDLDNAGPAGSITSTARDMAQYARLMLGKGSYRGRRILSERTVEELHTPHMVIPRESIFDWLFPDAHHLLYGLGWILHDYHGVKVVEHGGQTDGMHGQLALVPELGLAVVVLTNSVLLGYPAAIGYRIVDAYLNRPPRDWSAELRVRLRPANESDSPQPVRISGTMPTLPPERLVGRYRHPMYGDAEVTLRDGVLLLGLLGRTVTLERWHYDTYRPGLEPGLVAAALPLATFERNGRGDVRALRFDATGDFARVREGERP